MENQIISSENILFSVWGKYRAIFYLSFLVCVFSSKHIRNNTLSEFRAHITTLVWVTC